MKQYDIATSDNCKGKWDTKNSFYSWVIFLENGVNLFGYSKRNDYPEIRDKPKLLARVIKRLRNIPDKYPEYKFGYFTPGIVKQIIFYKRTGYGEYNQQLLTCFPHGYQLALNDQFNTNQEILDILEENYTELKQGKIIQKTSRKNKYSRIGYSQRIDEKKLFSLDSSRFRTARALDTFIGQIVADGTSELELAMNFRKNYIEVNSKNFR